jgi:hypothetical protein
LPENIFAIKQQTEYIKNEVKNLIKKDFIGG